LLTANSWTKIWEGPEKLQQYLELSVKKVVGLYSIKEKLTSEKFSFSFPLQMDVFLNPITFLNALRQQTSRKCKIF
jgi:hypothetical protein